MPLTFLKRKKEVKKSIYYEIVCFFAIIIFCLFVCLIYIYIYDLVKLNLFSIVFDYYMSFIWN